LPGFERFAERERVRLLLAVEDNTKRHVQSLGENFTSVVGSFQHEFNAVKDTINCIDKKLDDKLSSLQNQISDLKDIFLSLNDNINDRVVKTINSNSETVGATNTASQALNLNAFDVMRSTPRKPSMSLVFPETWVSLLSEWTTNGLQDFIAKGTKGAWDTGLQQRFAKRYRAIKVLTKIAGRNDMKLIAAELDVAREQLNNMSLTVHMSMLYKNQCKYKPRQIVKMNKKK
jgi:hypothetical protein